MVEAVVEMKLTAAGTVPDSHRIPSSAHDESDSSDSEQPFSLAKVSRNFGKINRFCAIYQSKTPSIVVSSALLSALTSSS